MKFAARYLSQKNFFNLVRRGSTDLLGSGNVFLHETGLLLEADAPKLDLGWLFNFGLIEGLLTIAFRKILYSRISITVPYSQIILYRKAGLLRKKHLIVYKTLDSHEDKTFVRFKLLRSSRRQEKEFSYMLKSNLEVVKSLLTKVQDRRF